MPRLLLTPLVTRCLGIYIIDGSGHRLLGKRPEIIFPVGTGLYIYVHVTAEFFMLFRNYKYVGNIEPSGHRIVPDWDDVRDQPTC